MTPMEIALLVIGVIIFALSFFLPEGKTVKSEKDIQEEQAEIRRLMEQELDGMKLKVNEAADESVDYAVEKAERSLERVSNEKIMAVNEYGQTIIEEINKNHQEVMFLYDMLKDKHTDLTNQVRKADAAAREIESLSASAKVATKGLQQELNVISVTKKGLTDEQKAVFDEVDKFGSAVQPSQTLAQMVPPMAPQTVVQPTTQEMSMSMTSSIPTLQQSASIEPERKGEIRDVLTGMVYTQSDNGFAPLAGSNGAAVINVTPEPTAQNVASPEPVNNNQRILMLHQQGMATVDIAKTLKLGVGEVKLVIDLFK